MIQEVQLQVLHTITIYPPPLPPYQDRLGVYRKKKKNHFNMTDASNNITIKVRRTEQYPSINQNRPYLSLPFRQHPLQLPIYFLIRRRSDPFAL